MVLRPPLIYGPGVPANFLSLLRAVDRGIPLPLGAVRNRRSLVSVTNLGSALAAALTHPNAAGKVFAVSDGEDVSTPELIKAMARGLRKPARLLPVPVPILRSGAAIIGRGPPSIGWPAAFTLNSSAIRADLGWKPPQTLAKGLGIVARWYAVQRGRKLT